MSVTHPKAHNHFQPLATRLRPKTPNEFIGQTHLLSEGRPLSVALETGHLHSMILWGPPGTGKTTLALLLASRAKAVVEKTSAVFAGVSQLRTIIKAAEKRQSEGVTTVLFVDEVHRFNKSQQDAFLPYIENGTFIFIGATTENPSFALNNALLSRVCVYILERLSKNDLLQLISKSCESVAKETSYRIHISDDVHSSLAQAADGDARRCLNFLEMMINAAPLVNQQLSLEKSLLQRVLSHGVRRFDKRGEDFYDQISALHKSVRGSSPDAALYWFARMIDGGCDPLYIARRVVRMASEDIGNADPRALRMALDAWESYERLGSPEGELAIAQAIIYCAVAAKSNAVYSALNAIQNDVKGYGSLEVPLHLRNAPTSLMKKAGFGKDYRYPHDEPDGYAAGEHYFPEGMPKKRYYYPKSQGLEIKIKEKLDLLQQLDQKKIK